VKATTSSWVVRFVSARQCDLKPFAEAKPHQVRALPARLKFGKADAQNFETELPPGFSHNVVGACPAGGIARQTQLRKKDSIAQSAIPHFVGEPADVCGGDGAILIFTLDQHGECQKAESNSRTDIPERDVKLSSSG